MDKAHTQEIIARLKVVRAEKGYSYQRIADMTEEIGEAVSLSTVKRVFADGVSDFRWATIKPIATVVLGVGFETPKPNEDDPDQPHRYYAVIEGLKAVVEAKGDLIASKNQSITFLKRQLHRQQIFTAILTIILGALLVIDMFNSNIGFFWMG